MSYEKAAGGGMSAGEPFKAEIVFIRDFVETEKANIIQLGAEPQVSTKLLTVFWEDNRHNRVDLRNINLKKLIFIVLRLKDKYNV